MSDARNLRTRWATVSLAAIGITAGLIAQAANPPPDANLFTTYTMGTGYKSISWIVCGLLHNPLHTAEHSVTRRAD
jgi:hypothetical protein